MKKNMNIIYLLICALFACSKTNTSGSVLTYQCKLSFNDSSSLNPDAPKYQRLLDQMTAAGVPGIMMSVHRPKRGIWLGSSGKADLASGIPILPCNITRMGSTVKTITATAIMKLKEEGKLKLENKVSDYLDASVLKDIANANLATIQQLLNHSSGIYNYIQNLHFQAASLNDLTKTWKPMELLSYARKKSPYFAPGEDLRYSNTNYILLGMIIDTLTGKPFWKYFEEQLFRPLSMHSSAFAATDNVPKNIVRGYIDLYSNLNLTDATHYSGWDYFTADGGLISNVYDLNNFIRSLLNGEIISQASVNQMLSMRKPTVVDDSFFEMGYGLGIFEITTDWGPGYIHSGDAIGYYATMVYFPRTKTTIVWATNGNYGKIDNLISAKAAMEKIFRTVLED
ncbi:MAG: class A beta-lactamase-related serine hydrolase [Chitinophagaceae bacterium]|nr:MAG: class A beta-lactamase-related serine hydrolase [Chitinophagaceae bacterium]